MGSDTARTRASAFFGGPVPQPRERPVSIKVTTSSPRSRAQECAPKAEVKATKSVHATVQEREAEPAKKPPASAPPSALGRPASISGGAAKRPVIASPSQKVEPTWGPPKPFVGSSKYSRSVKSPFAIFSLGLGSQLRSQPSVEEMKIRSASEFQKMKKEYMTDQQRAQLSAQETWFAEKKAASKASTPRIKVTSPMK